MQCAVLLTVLWTVTGMARANDLEYAAARAAIENLLARYTHGIDYRDPDGFASVFTEDGVLNHGRGITRGREALREFIRGEAAADKERAAAAGEAHLAPPRHVISNILVDLHGDRANVRAYWVYYTTGDDGQPRVSMYGNCRNEVVKRNGEWLIQRRIVYNEHAEGRQSGVLQVD
jgi:uncharacterized protein (TIGR02246 family)